MSEAPDCCTASPPTDCADLWVQLVGEDDQKTYESTPWPALQRVIPAATDRDYP